MDEACSKALQHVHNGTDTENQWRRAVQCLRTMDELRVALAWQRLSAPLQTRITLSQYKMLFKCALRAAEREAEKERVVVVELPVYENPSAHSEPRSAETPKEGKEEQSNKEQTTQTHDYEPTLHYREALEDIGREMQQLMYENESLSDYNERLSRENFELKEQVIKLSPTNQI